MPSKHPSTSVRIPPTLLAEIDAHAQGAGLTRHAAILLLLKRGLGQSSAEIGQLTPDPWPVLKALHGTPSNEPAKSNQPPAKEVLAKAEAKAAHLAKPKPRRSAWDLSKVQVGPSPNVPGARLKGNTPPKGKR